MDNSGFSRRDILQLAGVGGGLVFASALPGCAGLALGGRDFNFVQLSDVHWGYDNTQVNPDFKGSLPKAITAVNSLEHKPDFGLALLNLGHALRELGREEEARACWGKAIRLDPSLAAGYFA